jgi:isopentenyl diphosphate isomerase/L-lactate dehydrogenase-like FMN-dependent dehydrogenase
MDKATLERKGYSVAALRALARKELPRMLFDMVDGGAGDEITMRNNEAALAAIELVPTLLAGAPKRDQSVELFGARLPTPVVIGPTGLAGLLWPRAELAAARAAARFGTIYCLSHASTATIEEVGAATAGPKWMQTFSTRIAASPRSSRRARRRLATKGSSSPSTIRWSRGATATRAMA